MADRVEDASRSGRSEAVKVTVIDIKPARLFNSARNRLPMPTGSSETNPTCSIRRLTRSSLRSSATKSNTPSTGRQITTSFSTPAIGAPSPKLTFRVPASHSNARTASGQGCTFPGDCSAPRRRSSPQGENTAQPRGIVCPSLQRRTCYCFSYPEGTCTGRGRTAESHAQQLLRLTDHPLGDRPIISTDSADHQPVVAIEIGATRVRSPSGRSFSAHLGTSPAIAPVLSGPGAHERVGDEPRSPAEHPLPSCSRRIVPSPDMLIRPLQRVSLLAEEKLVRYETAAEGSRAAVRGNGLLLSKERLGVFHRSRTTSVSVL